MALYTVEEAFTDQYGVERVVGEVVDAGPWLNVQRMINEGLLAPAPEGAEVGKPKTKKSVPKKSAEPKSSDDDGGGDGD